MHHLRCKCQDEEDVKSEGGQLSDNVATLSQIQTSQPVSSNKTKENLSNLVVKVYKCCANFANSQKCKDIT